MMSFKRLRATLIAALLLPCFVGQAHATTGDFGNRPQVDAFIKKMVREHGFDRAQLSGVMSGAKLRPDIIKAITRPAERKPWHEYRPIFITESRIEGGLRFWRENAETLARAQREFGVPASVIVAIIGVETRYGKHKGRYPVIDALSTLAFEYPPRGEFFASELEHFLLMTREERIDPLSLTGSYAGAMGLPQFISSSFRHYAVDFDGDGKRNIWDNRVDAIGSVANYLKLHGWRAGQLVTHRIEIDTDAAKRFSAENKLKPHFQINSLHAHKVALPAGLDAEEKAALIALEGKQANEHWLGFNNFYAITRYNHSPLYAMAVHQLSEAIEKRRAEQTAARVLTK